MIWNILDHFSPREAWGDPAKMNKDLLFLLDKTRGMLPHGCRIKIHCGFGGNGHSKKSQHYLGNAADFHVIGIPFLESESLIMTYLHVKGLIEKVGVGIYPDWHSPGFHLDVRGDRASWGRVGKEYVSYQEALEYTRKKLNTKETRCKNY